MNLTTYIGQSHLVCDGKPIKRIIDKKIPTSMILYGNPGIGKTTLAKIISDELNITSFKLNAATMKLSELKEVIGMQKMYGKILIIMDEIHRLDSGKQNYLLPFLETDNVYIIGTTTENPYFAVNAALRSRLLLFQLKPITIDELTTGLKQIVSDNNRDISDLVLELIATISSGDVRMSMRILNFLFDYYSDDEIDITLVKETFENNVSYDSSNGEYYDLLSALQKSIRASDVNAALHYGARALKVGDEKSLFRRLIVTCYEDISLANPELAPRVESAYSSFMRVGMPEGRIIVANIIIDMALSPKSPAAYQAFDRAFADLNDKRIDEIPLHLVYNQPHKDSYTPAKARAMDNLPKNLKNTRYYEPIDAGRYEHALHQKYIERENGVKGR